MKTRLSSRLLLAAALAPFALTPAVAAPQAKPAAAHPVTSVERLGCAAVTRGMPLHEVERSLGAPRRKLSETVWVYRNFNAGFAQSPDDDCSTLVVTFTNGKVSDLQLVNDRAEIIFAARIEAKANAKLQVAAK